VSETHPIPTLTMPDRLLAARLATRLRRSPDFKQRDDVHGSTAEQGHIEDIVHTQDFEERKNKAIVLQALYMAHQPETIDFVLALAGVGEGCA